ncbi:MAG: hypothetical protein ACM3VZ_14935 [Acidobacteriota bacterium]
MFALVRKGAMALAMALVSVAHAADVVDASSLNNKVMAGYQGWHMTSADGSGAGWRHWAPNQVPSASNITFDLWPDLREFTAGELTPTAFKYANGSTAGLYSAYNATTVARHVKWMKDYGVDGVFVQRFVSEAINMRSVRDKVLQNVRQASEGQGRVFANMYDISGASASTVISNIKSDWMHLVDDLTVTTSTRYVRHNGRPVVAIWGFGFSDRPGTAAQLKDLLQWFKSGAPDRYRATVMLGVSSGWRGHSSEWQAAYRLAGVISPWTVGRYTDDAGADNWRSYNLAPDLAALSGTGVAYMPVVWPGFSWYNLQRGTSPLNKIPRRGGRFFWRQAYNSVMVGAKMMYVAMFDEVDEGTAMYKIAENAGQAPTTGKFVTLNADGETVPSDWYLRLFGAASQMLRGERPLTALMPSVSDLPPPGSTPDPVPPGSDDLLSGQRLNVGESLVSLNDQYRFSLQSDGNLVLRNASGQALWSSGTAGRSGARLELQSSDGNLVLYSTSGAAIWATATGGLGATRLVMQNDGNLVLYTSSGKAVWATKTNGL